MKTKIITQSGTQYVLKENNWLTDGKTDYKFYCHLGADNLPYFNQDIQINDQLIILTHNGQTLVTSPARQIKKE